MAHALLASTAMSSLAQTAYWEVAVSNRLWSNLPLVPLQTVLRLQPMADTASNALLSSTLPMVLAKVSATSATLGIPTVAHALLATTAMSSLAHTV